MRPALVLAVLVLAGTGCGANRDDDVRRNEEIIASLPVFPGAKRTTTSVHPFEDPDRGEEEWVDRPAGYVTRLMFEVPDGTSARDILRFFDAEMPDEWARRPGTLGPGTRCYVREDAVIELEAILLENERGRLDFAVDVSGKRDAIPGCVL